MYLPTAQPFWIQFKHCANTRFENGKAERGIGAKFKESEQIRTIFKELKALPPDRLERAADYIRRLRTVNQTERNAILRSTAGIMAGVRGEDLPKTFRRAVSK